MKKSSSNFSENSIEPGGFFTGVQDDDGPIKKTIAQLRATANEMLNTASTLEKGLPGGSGSSILTNSISRKHAKSIKEKRKQRLVG